MKESPTSANEEEQPVTQVPEANDMASLTAGQARMVRRSAFLEIGPEEN